MQQLYPDLWISRPEFPNQKEEPALMMHGFFLKHPEGNLIISRIENDLDIEEIQNLGGASRHYITHWHEASVGINKVRSKIKSQFWCHELAAPEVSLFAIADNTFNEDTTHFKNFQIFHTPGHTSGSSVFLYKSPYGKTYLFLGDAICFMEGKWGVVIVDESNVEDLRDSFEILHSMKPDVVLMGVTVGELAYIEVTESSWADALVEAAANPLDLRHKNNVLSEFNAGEISSLMG